MRFGKLGRLAAATALIAAGCGPHDAPSSTAAGPASPGASATVVPLHVRGFGTKQQPTVLYETKKGRRIYVVRAIQFEGDNAGSTGGTAVLQQPHVAFLARSGAGTIADAPKATVKQRDKSVLMTGGVHARSAEGALLTCDTLRYDGGTERFHGEGHVQVTGPNGERLDGDYLDADVRLHDARVTSRSRP